ncbi:MAG: TonB family protein [Myxococcales bacterium]|nr:TonB family protein [Myxococcales bacterium]
MAAPRRPSRVWEALAVAALANAGLVRVLDHVIVPAGRLPLTPVLASASPEVPAAPALTPSGMSGIGVVTVTPPAIPLDVILGTGDDAAGHGRAPRPSSADLPGARAADRGGGAEGGTDTWADRRDRADDAALRARVWTSDQGYLTPRTPGARTARSPEAITRAPIAAYGDRAPQPLAQAGDDRARTGAATGPGADGTPTSLGQDDTHAGSPGATAPVRQDGAAARVREAAYVDRGERAVDVAARGPSADDRAVAASSDQRRPDPYDLTPPRAGGGPDGEGVRGLAAPGVAPDGWGPGTAASRAEAPAGDDGAPTYASRRDPYFLELFRRLDRRVEYPHELALSMTSGRVVASLVLLADGSFAEIGLHATSGHGAFDREVTDALKAVARLGPVPSALLGGRAALRVRIPYTFKSPMIQ